MAENDKPKATGFRKVLKVVGIVLGGLVGVFIVLMVVALIASGSGTAGDAQEAVAAGSTANDVTELRSEVAALTEQVARVDASVAALRRDLATLTDRVALVEVDAANRAAPERTAGAEAASLVAEAPRAVAVQTAPEPAQPAQRANSPEMWRGIVLAPEHRCSSYDSDDYRYSQSVEPRIVAQLGGIVYGPYTGRYFTDTGQTDIEHIVARSEAHDSGLCAASAATRRRFAADLRNLTLAGPSVNRQPENREGCGRVVAAVESVLVRSAHRRGAARIPAYHRPPGGRGARGGPAGLRQP